MRWHTVLPLTIVAHIEDDTDVQSVLGSPAAFFMVGERDFRCPSMRWQLIANPEGENFEESLLQIDFWVRTVADAATLEAALRRLLHHEIEVTIGGVRLWSKYVDGRPLGGAKDGTVARSLDFRQTYLRGRYAA
jgi:hypothetical protein